MQRNEFRILLVIGLLILGLSFWMSGVFKNHLNFEIGIPLFLIGLVAVFISGKFLGYGHPKPHLPTGKNFKKIWEFREGEIVFLLLEHNGKMTGYDYSKNDCFARSDIRLYWIYARDLPFPTSLPEE